MWQNSEYGRVLNLQALHVLNMTEYALNMPGFWIWQGSEYARVTQVSKYTTIRPNVWIYNNRQGSEYVSYYT